MCARIRVLLLRTVVVATVILVTATFAWSGSYKVLHSFNVKSMNPSSGLVVDKAGNAYGTTAAGGFHKGTGGTVYQISPTTGFHLIYGFSGPDGLQPQGNLTIDDAGNLYGTTVYGGSNTKGCNNQGCGTVFRLSPPVNGGAWTETVLHSFTGGDDGSNPTAGVILDSANKLYGTTQFGGVLQRGTVFQLSPGPGETWTETVVYSMEQGGGEPLGSLTFDSVGNLYGTTSNRGAEDGGTVFELSPNFDGTWTYNLVYAFNGFNGSKDGNGPGAGVTLDAAGNIYGTTELGGDFGLGTVFEVILDSGNWTESILHSFAGHPDGATPMATLVLDEQGNLYGTTLEGGRNGCLGRGCGTLFELMPGQDGSWKERRLGLPVGGDVHQGDRPTTSLLLDGFGYLYGTMAGGSQGGGVIFQINPQ